MNRPIKGMCVFSNPSTGEAVAEEIGTVLDMDIVQDFVHAWTEVQNRRPKVLLIDMEREPEAGLRLARDTASSFADTPVVMFSPKKDPDLIIDCLRAGAADYCVFPDQNGDSLTAAVKRVLNRSADGHKTGKIVSFFSMKGGQGTTSLAVNVADQIHQVLDRRVLLLDLNLYMGSICGHLNFTCTYTPFDMVRDISRMDEDLLLSSLSRHGRGFYILSAPEEVSDAESISPENISQILNISKFCFDYIVIDLAHDFSDRTLVALEASDRIFLTVRQNFSVIKSAQKVFQFFHALNYPTSKVELLVNRFVKGSELTPEDLTVVFQQPVFGVVQDGGRIMEKAISKGRTLADAYPRTRINTSIKDIALKIADIEKQPQQSWFRRLFSAAR